jgi:opacity protein-like surface antigen
MRILSLALCVLSIAPVSAIQDIGSVVTNQYFGLEVGANHLEMTNNNKGQKVGYAAGAKYGFDFNNGVRVEFAGKYRKNVKSTKYTLGETDIVLSKEYSSNYSWSYMANLIYDMHQLTTKTFIPYLGVGVGYCQNTQHNKIKYPVTSNTDKLKDNRFAYQGIVGARYALNVDYSTALEYQYFCGQSHAKHHNVSLSLNRHF